jgi:hypothetical protein
MLPLLCAILPLMLTCFRCRDAFDAPVDVDATPRDAMPITAAIRCFRRCHYLRRRCCMIADVFFSLFTHFHAMPLRRFAAPPPPLRVMLRAIFARRWLL